MAANWDPFKEMDRMLGSLALNSRNAPAMPMDLYREDDHFVLAVDLPGVDPSSIDVSCEDRTLTIRAERRSSVGEGGWLLRERPTGAVARQLALGRGLAFDKITADYDDGVLTLTIPVADEAKPRRIEINRVQRNNVIEPSA